MCSMWTSLLIQGLVIPVYYILLFNMFLEIYDKRKNVNIEEGKNLLCDVINIPDSIFLIILPFKKNWLFFTASIIRFRLESR